MTPRSCFRVLFVPAAAWFLLEVYTAFFLGSSLPLPVWYFLLSLGLIALLVALLVGLDLRLGGRFPTRWALAVVVLAGGFVVTKLFLAGGTDPPLPFLWVGLPFLLLAWRTTATTPSEESRFFLLLILLLSILISTDVVHVVWRTTRGPELASLLSGLLVAGTGTALLLGGLRYAEPLMSPLRENRRAGLYGIGIAVALVGLLWVSDRTTADWERRSAYSGSPPEIRLRPDAARAERPNLIVISVDALRRDVLRPPFPEDLRIPHLRALRRDSTRFERTYTSSSLTLPAQASLLSGQLPLQHGATGAVSSSIAPSVPLFSQHLRAAGYATAAFTGGGVVGKKYGFLRGFDRFWEQPTPYGQFVPGGVELTALLLTPTPYSFPVKIRDHAGPSPRPADPVFRNAARWLTASDRGDSPVFAYLHTFHLSDYRTPFPDTLRRLRDARPRLARAFAGADTRAVDLTSPLTKEERRALRTREPFMSDTDWRRYRKRIDSLGSRSWHDRVLRQIVRLYPPDLRVLQKAGIANGTEMDWVNMTHLSGPESRYVLRWPQVARRLQRLTPSALRARRWLYRRELERFDRSLGRFLDSLKKHGIYDSSLVVLTAGHGEGFSWDPLALGHGRRVGLDWEAQINDSILHVPLWIKLPGAEGRDRSHGEPLQLTDVLPMVLRYAGVVSKRWPRGDAGWRLGALLQGSSETRRRLVQGTLPSGRRGEPKFFVRAGRHTYTVNTPIRTAYFRSVEDEGNAEPFVGPRALPASRRRTLRRSMARRLEWFLKHSKSFEGQKPQYADFLRKVGNLPSVEPSS